MLVSKKFANGDVVSFKLVNGDEIIAKIEEETVKKPSKKNTLGKWFVILVILFAIVGIYIYR